MSSEYSAYSNLPCKWYGTACADKNCCEGNGLVRCRESHNIIIRDRLRGEYHKIRTKNPELSKTTLCLSFNPLGLEKMASSSQINISA